jgi:hypothetical protein
MVIYFVILFEILVKFVKDDDFILKTIIKNYI